MYVRTHLLGLTGNRLAVRLKRALERGRDKEMAGATGPSSVTARDGGWRMEGEPEVIRQADEDLHVFYV